MARHTHNETFGDTGHWWLSVWQLTQFQRTWRSLLPFGDIYPSSKSTAFSSHQFILWMYQMYNIQSLRPLVYWLLPHSLCISDTWLLSIIIWHGSIFFHSPPFLLGIFYCMIEIFSMIPSLSPFSWWWLYLYPCVEHSNGSFIPIEHILAQVLVLMSFLPSGKKEFSITHQIVMWRVHLWVENVCHRKRRELCKIECIRKVLTWTKWKDG